MRDWDRTKEYGIAKLLTRLNAIRRAHPATQTYHDLHMLETRNPAMVAFYRHLPAELSENGKSDTVIVVVNLDGHNAQQGQVHIELGDLGLTGSELRLKDELTGRDFTWSYDNYVSLAPWATWRTSSPSVIPATRTEKPTESEDRQASCLAL